MRGIIKASLTDIKDNSFIGVTGMPQADGSQKAVEIHHFPDALRGTGEGHRPWDLMPNSTMTNAAGIHVPKELDPWLWRDVARAHRHCLDPPVAASLRHVDRISRKITGSL